MNKSIQVLNQSPIYTRYRELDSFIKNNIENENHYRYYKSKLIQKNFNVVIGTRKGKLESLIITKEYNLSIGKLVYISGLIILKSSKNDIGSWFVVS